MNKPNLAQFTQLYGSYFPQSGIEWVYSFFEQETFSFKVTGDRISKKGDFRYFRAYGPVQITINSNLNAYEFLLVFLHELAHYFVYKKYKFSAKPHGEEWKFEYRHLLIQAIETINLPVDIRAAFIKHLARVKAGSGQDAFLMQTLMKYDMQTQALKLLADIPENSVFEFRNRKFRKLQKQRTRIRCTDLFNLKTYLIHQTALVKPV